MLLAADSGGLLSADLPRGHRRAEVEEPWMVSSGSNISPLHRGRCTVSRLVRAFSQRCVPNRNQFPASHATINLFFFHLSLVEFNYLYNSACNNLMW